MHLSSWLQARLPASPKRRRPFELIYAADELPPTASLLVLAMQHAMTVLAFVAYVLAAAKMANIPVPQTQSIVTLTLIAMGLITAMQAWGGKWGSGSLLVFQPDPMMISFASIAIATHGIGSLVSVTLLVAVVTMVAGPVIGRLRPLFPPTVVGTVVCMAGLGLVSPAMHNALGLDAHKQIHGNSVLVAAVTMVCIVFCSVWGGRRLKLMGMLAGIAAGSLTAYACQMLSGAEWMQQAPWLALPQPIAPNFSLSPTLMGAIIFITLLNQLDNIGCLSIMEKTDNADWRRADMAFIGRGIRANGLGDLLAGLLGSFPTAPCSANIALAHATRSTSRYIGLATAAMLLLVALSPKLTVLLTLIPDAVLGAVELYACAYLMVSGIEMIATRALDSRGIFMVGLSLSAGLATMLIPELGAQAPEQLRLLAGDGFIVAGSLVVALNLLFRWGTKQQASKTLDQHTGIALHQQITDFVEQQGAAWSARHDVVRRAASAALEAAEAITATGHGHLLSIAGSFDEFRMDLTLTHAGPPIALDRTTSHMPMELPTDAIWDADDLAMDAALQRMSHTLLHHLADKVSSGSDKQHASWLCLHFEH